MDLIAYFALPYVLRLEENGVFTNPNGYPSQLVDTWRESSYIAPDTHFTDDTSVFSAVPSALAKAGFNSRQEVLACLARLGVNTPALLKN